MISRALIIHSVFGALTDLDLPRNMSEHVGNSERNISEHVGNISCDMNHVPAIWWMHLRLASRVVFQ